MESLTNFFEKLHHHTQAEKALAAAKALEAKKLSKGYRYVSTDSRTWKLEKGETGSQKAAKS